MRDQRTYKQAKEREYEVPLHGRRNRTAAANSLQFLARIEGVLEQNAHVRGANGMKWRLS